MTATRPGEPTGPAAGRPLRPLARAGAWLLAWLVLFAAGPGLLFEQGSAPLATLGLGVGLAAGLRPGPRAFWVEWGLASLGFTLLNAWMVYVWWGTYLFVGPLPGLYMAVGLALARWIVARGGALAPLAFAACWTGAETARTLVDPPWGYGWMRLGTFAAEFPASARLWGTGGLSFFLALAAALPAAAVAEGRGRKGLVRGALAGVAVLVLALGIAGLPFRAPPTVPGPLVLAVQPAIEQVRKQVTATPEELLGELLTLTSEGLAAAPEPPDLVAWGETMLQVPIIDEACLAAWEEGVRPPDWARHGLEPRTMRFARRREAELVAALLGARGRPGMLPEGTSFLTGAEQFIVRDGALRRVNGVHLWSARTGERTSGGKVHLVPGGEQMAGFERFELIRRATFAVAGYLPDLVAWPRTEVLTLEGRGGERWRMGISVCFDNAYDDPYIGPLRRGPVDFHLVCSNEAWFRESFEMDQMIAFTRLAAVASGRSIVRVTNSGVTALVDPSGRVTRLERGGVDRSVPGAEAFRVPVPPPSRGPGGGERRPRPPFVALEPFWLGLWLLLPLALALRARLRRPAGAA